MLIVWREGPIDPNFSQLLMTAVTQNKKSREVHKLLKTFKYTTVYGRQGGISQLILVDLNEVQSSTGLEHRIPVKDRDGFTEGDHFNIEEEQD